MSLLARTPVVGLVGHTDHGKSSLAEALTGAVTDRLEEERRRGMSIELGFALLDLADGSSASLIDVPGHETLIRTMIAGAGGFDLFVLVVAADDGPMPQTREHVLVLRALGLRAGVIALTKCDLASSSMRRSAALEAQALVPQKPLVEVSVRDGLGLSKLRKVLSREVTRNRAGLARADEPDEPGLLHIDRVFSIRGVGTVVTGTSRAGRLSVGDRIRLLPAGAPGRIRGIQIHDDEVAVAEAGQRVALNIAGLRRYQPARGDVITVRESPLAASHRLDVELIDGLTSDSLKGLRVQVHHGTRDAPARVAAIEPPRIVQLRLERELVARPRERVIIRSIAPAQTLGGAVVVDPRPARHSNRHADRLRLLRTGEPDAIVRCLEESGDLDLSADPDVWARASSFAVAFHRFPRSRWLAAAEKLKLTGLREAGQRAYATPSAHDERMAATLELLGHDGHMPRTPKQYGDLLGCAESDVRLALDRLHASGETVRAKPDIYFSTRYFDIARDFIVSQESITIAELRDALGISRKYAQALLEHCDAEGFTVRHGNAHIPRRCSAS